MTDQSFDIRSLTGLSREEAARRITEEGYNELPSSRGRSVFAIARDVVREPMFLMLVAGGILYLFLGEIQEALMLLGFVFVVMGITLYQERKTERALDALRDISSPRALVIRDGAEERIAGRDVARGDVLVIREGDRVPADAVLFDCNNLAVDESLLTGESLPVRKTAAEGMPEPIPPGGDDHPFVYSGTLVVQGQGMARVTATGLRTEIGKIGRALQTMESELTPLQKETGEVVRKLALLGLGVCFVAFAAYGLTRGNWLDGLLAGITLAMAILPEEFPVILTIFLAMGAWRLSRAQVLTRRMPTVETLGSATVLCVDKTGTLTQNRMTVHKLNVAESTWSESADGTTFPEAFHGLVEFSILASQSDPFDPMEKAIHQMGARYLARTEHVHGDWKLVREYPLSKNLLAMSHVWRSPNEESFVIAVKGSPEAILDLCHLEEKRLQEISLQVQAMAEEGLRVLGVAKAAFGRGDLPGDQHEFSFQFLGLVGLADPLRPTVPEAVRQCYNAGVRVVMLTGDYPGTARQIAGQIGLAAADRVITGQELWAMSDKELQEKIWEVNIFARVVPEQKLRLVNALKANGEIVGMTGDGVNDAPSLKAAHIGIAMGGRGTDVAREASALVLLEDDFSSIVAAIRMGRRIFDNIKKAVVYTLAIHIPIVGISLIPVLTGCPFILYPFHIVFLELIIDPACSIVFEAEPEEDGVMSRPPRNAGTPLFNRKLVGISLLQGLSILLIVFAVFAISTHRGQSEAEARALTFTTLIIANLCLILTNRSWSRTILSMMKSPNAALWWVLSGALVFLGIVLYVPQLRELFKFSYLHGTDILICAAAGIFSILWFEMMKIVHRKRQPLL